MGVAKTKTAYFVVWTIHGMVVDKITFDKESMKSNFGIVCFYHVTYAFQSESTLYSCLNVKELLAPCSGQLG